MAGGLRGISWVSPGVSPGVSPWGSPRGSPGGVSWVPGGSSGGPRDSLGLPLVNPGGEITYGVRLCSFVLDGGFRRVSWGAVATVYGNERQVSLSGGVPRCSSCAPRRREAAALPAVLGHRFQRRSPLPSPCLGACFYMAAGHLLAICQA